MKAAEVVGCGIATYRVQRKARSRGKETVIGRKDSVMRGGDEAYKVQNGRREKVRGGCGQSGFRTRFDAQPRRAHGSGCP
jgi:hypothetical protein